MPPQAHLAPVVSSVSALRPCPLTAVSVPGAWAGMIPNANMYLTLPGSPISIPAHSDKQDVFIIQLAGQKAW